MRAAYPHAQKPHPLSSDVVLSDGLLVAECGPLGVGQRPWPAALVSRDDYRLGACSKLAVQGRNLFARPDARRPDAGERAPCDHSLVVEGELTPEVDLDPHEDEGVDDLP